MGVYFFLFLGFPKSGEGREIYDTLSVSSGVYTVLHPKWQTWEFDLEYKFSLKSLALPSQTFLLRPLIGAMMNLKGSTYVYFGLNFDFLFFNRLLFAPGIAMGAFFRGKGRDLGYPIEFRSGLEIAWQFLDTRRVGIHFYHLSNGSLRRRNPGSESLIFFYEIPLQKEFPFRKSNAERS